MVGKWMPLIAAGAAIETFTQICLKKGAVAHNETSGILYYLKLLSNKWVISGILMFLVEMVLWVFLLAHIPLSVVFPLTGMEKIFVVFISAYTLKERVNGIEMAGVALTAAGIAVIAYGG
ncbi:MAG: EamA family transporter [Nitrospirae bacterium]|nr:EamA family transporter [Nitrospirota bacterium]